MDKLCINCATENPADAVFCSECGMSLTRAPTGDPAEKARSAADVRDVREGKGNGMHRIRRCLLLAVMACWSVLFGAVGCYYGFMAAFFVGAGLEGYSTARNYFLGATALALAPWVIVFGARWWSSRTPAPPEATD